MSLIRRANISDKALDLSNFNRMVDYVNMLAGMTVDQNMTISKGPPVFMLGIRQGEVTTSSAVDYSDFTFGFSISGKVVTVKAGGVYHGKRTLWYNCPDTNITITADYQYVWVEYTIGGGSAQIKGPSTILPLTDATYYRCWLHQFRYQNGVVSLYRIGHLGNIELPGVYS